MDEMETIFYVLKDFGLSEKETQIYLELLKKPDSTLQQIAKYANVNRTTTHNVLQVMLGKSVVTKVEKNNVAHYTANDPEKLVEFMQHKLKLMQNIVPKLNKLKTQSAQSIEVEVHQGAKGAYNIYADVFKHKGLKRYFGNFTQMLPLMQFYIPNARELRMTRNIPARILMEPYSDSFLENSLYKKITELKQSDEFKDFPGMAFVYEDTFSIFSHRDEISGVIIRNKNIAKFMELTFELLWKHIT